ncbi:MAG: hypothetical protein ACTHY1_03540 [Lactobacillus helveticus]
MTHKIEINDFLLDEDEDVLNQEQRIEIQQGDEYIIAEVFIFIKYETTGDNVTEPKHTEEVFRNVNVIVDSVEDEQGNKINKSFDELMELEKQIKIDLV